MEDCPLEILLHRFPDSRKKLTDSIQNHDQVHEPYRHNATHLLLSNGLQQP